MNFTLSKNGLMANINSLTNASKIAHKCAGLANKFARLLGGALYGKRVITFLKMLRAIELAFGRLLL